MAVDKQRLLDSIDLKQETIDLLGNPQGGSRFHCYRKEAHANDDKNGSLTISPQGYYKCHTCSVRGDFFQLYMDVKGIQADRFGEVLLFFSRKYGINVDTSISVSKSSKSSKKTRAIIGKTKAKKSLAWPLKDILTDKGSFVSDWLMNQYGINKQTIIDWGIGWSTQATRLFIPIPVNKVWVDKDTNTPDDLVNIRKHDIMRYHCTWQKGDEAVSRRPVEIRTPADTGGWKAVWNKGGGKVIGLRGHNSVYVYPMSNIDKEGDVWLVGGELKALLLTQLGFNAVTFTCGEGSYANDLLNLFTNRTVRVVYDIDKAGVDGAANVAQALANNGAIVSVGTMPKDGMPDNGDITDYLRINEWNIESLSNIVWTKVDRKSEEVKQVGQDSKIVYKSISFSGLTEGSRLGQYINVPVLVSGRGDTPYAVPLEIKATCPSGQASAIPNCKTCSLPQCGFEKELKLTSESVVDLTGMQKSRLDGEIKQIAGIPRKCNRPKLKVKYATVEKLVTVPTVDINDDIGDSMYRHHRIYYISGGENIRENVAYKAKGKIVGDPKDNKFTLAAISTEPLDGDVFSYKFSHEMHEELKRALWTDCNNHSEVIWRTVRDLRDHILFKYGQDTMIMVEWMSWFMPFQFKIGQYLCHKVCPEIMVLGPTRVGKSTMAKDLTIHFGAGRYADCGANTTFVGLIGGNADIGSSRVFTWGLIPTSHGGVVVLDEYNKLSYEVMGGLTNQKSSGVAERITNSGVRKTKAFVRYLTLCNPRGRKKLEAYETPLDAAIDVVGTPQDLARIDFLYVAQTVRDPTILNTFHSPEVTHRYKRELARYHLKWTWSLNKGNINFKDPKYILDVSQKLSGELGKLALIQPAESKFKVGRAAIAIASMCYSYDADTGGVMVENEHIDLAYQLFSSTYSKYIRGASVRSGILPKQIIELFDRVEDWRKLRVLSTSDRWGAEDLSFVFGHKDAASFKYLAQLEYCLVKRQGSFFIPVAEEFQELISEYINNRKNKRSANVG